MDLPQTDRVDARLAGLLADFGPAEVTERQRAEDLVAAALAMYGGALRRMRAVAEEHGAHDLAAAWATRSPLGDLLRIHRADSPAPPPQPADESRRVTGMIEAILDELDGAPEAIRARSIEMLALISELHEAGLAQLMGVVDDELRPDHELASALAADDLVASVLLVHGLHPQPLEERLARALEDLDRHSGASAAVSLVDVSRDVVHLRVDGTSPNDAYRFRLEVERTLTERLPDVAMVRIDGGDEPVQSTAVHIPVESLTVRRSGAASSEMRS